MHCGEQHEVQINQSTNWIDTFTKSTNLNIQENIFHDSLATVQIHRQLIQIDLMLQKLPEISLQKITTSTELDRIRPGKIPGHGGKNGEDVQKCVAEKRVFSPLFSEDKMQNPLCNQTLKFFFLQLEQCRKGKKRL